MAEQRLQNCWMILRFPSKCCQQLSCFPSLGSLEKSKLNNNDLFKLYCQHVTEIHWACSDCMRCIVEANESKNENWVQRIILQHWSEKHPDEKVPTLEDLRKYKISSGTKNE